MIAVELRESFVRMRSATRILFLTAAQRNDLAVLSNSFDRGTATLIW
jgi:hypothetical protein